ncbi:hypothetical protein DFJ77DRAFT_456720 [Powellomyces hirtus]|nr:hypothetical protein DFJ77DRAFT_456720 [Powellomyces hirtus]
MSTSKANDLSMGEGPPTYVEATASSSSSAAVSAYASVSLHELDKIRLMGISPEYHAEFRKVIFASGHQIQSERPYACSHQFKLVGNPWVYKHGSGRTESLRLVVMIMSLMVRSGWQLVLTTDISAKTYDKDMWMFRRAGAGVPQPQSFCVVSFAYPDQLRLIDGPDELLQVIRQTIQTSYRKGLQEEGTTVKGAPVFKLFGNPWVASGDETMYTRRFLLELLASFERIGWTIYASLDITTGASESDSSLDCWILAKH